MVTFKVDDVKVNSTIYTKDSFIQLNETLSITNSKFKRIKPNIQYYKIINNNDKLVLSDGQDLFAEAINLSYANHYPLTLSPDDIWMMIVRGFSYHINNNAEKYRKLFVDFDDKEKISIRRDDFVFGSSKNDWEGVFVDFVQGVNDKLKFDIKNLVENKFSTSTKEHLACFDIYILDICKNYFAYELCTLCGIPEITLLGTVEDWENLKQKTLELQKFDLEWWMGKLIPVLDEFIAAAKGKENKIFWKSFFKEQDLGSGSPLISGWINVFYPYLGSKADQINQKMTTCHSSEFPSSFATVPFVWKYYDELINMNFISGFVGINQNIDNTIQPAIGYAILQE